MVRAVAAFRTAFAPLKFACGKPKAMYTEGSMPWNEFSNHIRHLSARDKARVQQAYELGEKVHAGQMRKSGEPFFSHPIAVATILTTWGADADTVIAALLHDSVEDTPLTINEVEHTFSREVATLIEGVTKLSAEEFAQRPTLDEATETLRKMFRLMESDVRIIVIKLADRLHNMMTIEHLKPERQQAIAQETLDIYAKVAEQLSMQDLRHMLEELSLKVLEPSLHAQLALLREENEEKGEAVIRRIQEALHASAFSSPSIRMLTEHKSWQMLKEQWETRGMPVTGVPSLIVAIVCKSIPDCYYMLGTLHQLWRREAVSFQDYINAPLLNGYRGLHTTIILQDGTRVRCKLRTEDMHEYTKRGIATLCFDDQAHGLKQYMPWADRISPLVKDTKDRSQDFWEGLQKDILGQYITVYGTDGRTAAVPADATVLDAALYLYPYDASRIRGIRMGGKDAAFYHSVQHGDTVEILKDEHAGAQREWLSYVHTGYATAIIRSALVEGKSDQEKVSIGRELMQMYMTKNQGGFLEEFNESILSDSALELGYDSMAALYTAIADGHVDTSVAYDSLFRRVRRTTNSPKRTYSTVHLRIDDRDSIALRRLLSLVQSYAPYVKKMNLNEVYDDHDAIISISAYLTPDDRSAVAKQLTSMGARDIEIVSRTPKELMLLAAVIIPWALNPVIAKWLLFHGVEPLHLITIRLLTFALFAAAFFGIWRLLNRSPLTPIRNATLLALPSTLGNFGMTVSTYLALLFMPPSLHLTLLRLNTVILPTIQKRWTARRLFVLLLFLAALFSAIYLLLSLTSFDSSSLAGISLSLCTLLLYLTYSLTTERTLRQNRINVRYPYLLLHMGGLLGATGITLAAFQPLATLWNGMTPGIVAYVLLCVCLPHAAYSALLNRTKFKHFTDMLLLEVPIAIFFEILILGIVQTPYTYALMGLTLMGLLFWRWRKLSLPF